MCDPSNPKPARQGNPQQMGVSKNGRPKQLAISDKFSLNHADKRVSLKAWLELGLYETTKLLPGEWKAKGTLQNGKNKYKEGSCLLLGKKPPNQPTGHRGLTIGRFEVTRSPPDPPRKGSSGAETPGTPRSPAKRTASRPIPFKTWQSRVPYRKKHTDVR